MCKTYAQKLTATLISSATNPAAYLMLSSCSLLLDVLGCPLHCNVPNTYSSALAQTQLAGGCSLHLQLTGNSARAAAPHVTRQRRAAACCPSLSPSLPRRTLTLTAMADKSSVPANFPARSFDEVHKIMQAPGQPWELTTAEIRGQKYRVYKNMPPSLRSAWLMSKVSSPQYANSHSD